MLREMREENKKLRDDLKQISEKMNEENPIRKSKREKCVYPQK